MPSMVCVTLSAVVVLVAAVSGLTAPSGEHDVSAKSMVIANHTQLINLLNVSKDTALGQMMEKLKAMNHSEISRLMNETFGSNNTLREGKQFFGPFGGGFGGFGGGISPLLLLLLGRGGGFGGGFGGYPPPAPASSSGGFGDLATVGALTLLGLALIGRMPTQG